MTEPFQEAALSLECTLMQGFFINHSFDILNGDTGVRL